MRVFKTATLKVRNADGEFESFPALRGETSYDIAVANGYEGTQEEWLNMMTDENGWVTRYYELDEKKANKSDVYSKPETDSLLRTTNDGLVEESDFVSIHEILYGRGVFPLGFKCAISPNKLYICIANRNQVSSGYEIVFRLYRTKDFSLVGDVLTLTTSTSILESNRYDITMDDDFILLNYYDYDLSSYFNKCYRYTDTDVSPVDFANGASGPGGDSGHTTAYKFNPGTGGNNLWFWRGSSLYKLDKTTMSYSAVKVLDITFNNKSKFIGKCYSDGDDCVTLYYFAENVDSTYNTMSGVEIHLERINSDGTITELFTMENINSGTDFPFINLIAYDPQTAQVVISGTNPLMTNVYNDKGELTHTATRSLSDTYIGDIINGYLFSDNAGCDLVTLEAIDKVTIYYNFHDIFEYDRNYNVVPVPILENLMYSTDKVLAFEAQKIRLGGWRVNE